MIFKISHAEHPYYTTKVLRSNPEQETLYPDRDQIITKLITWSFGHALHLQKNKQNLFVTVHKFGRQTALKTLSFFSRNNEINTTYYVFNTSYACSCPIVLVVMLTRAQSIALLYMAKNILNSYYYCCVQTSTYSAPYVPLCSMYKRHSNKAVLVWQQHILPDNFCDTTVMQPAASSSKL